MSSTNKSLAQTLISFGEKYSQHHQNKLGYLPIIEHDKDWISPCELSPHDNTHNYWQPSPLKNEMGSSTGMCQLSFDNVESALSMQLHPDIKAYFTTMYSSEIDASCDEGQLSLLFAWNEEDFSRLQENIIGHILMKQRLKQSETVFFAVTDEEDIIISVMNSTGEVWVERVGCKPHKKLGNSLVEFISELTPKV